MIGIYNDRESTSFPVYVYNRDIVMLGYAYFKYNITWSPATATGTIMVGNSSASMPINQSVIQSWSDVRYLSNNSCVSLLYSNKNLVVTLSDAKVQWVGGNIERIGGHAFYTCELLTEAYFPLCTNVGQYAFANCLSLSTVSLPNCNIIGSYAFRYCSSLNNINVPLCRVIYREAFLGARHLSTIDLPNCSLIDNSVFAYCHSLSEVYLRGSSVISLVSSTGGYRTFYSTPIEAGSGRIYVPESLIYSYMLAPGWSSLSTVIYPIENP